MSTSNVSEVSSKIVVRVKGFKFFPMRVILEVEKEISDFDEYFSVRTLRKNDSYVYTLRVKSEISSN